MNLWHSLCSQLLVKSSVGVSRKPVQCSAVTVTKDSMIKSTGDDFSDADKLFEYMIEPVPPTKFFRCVSFNAVRIYYNDNNDRLTAFDPGQPG